MRLSNLKKAAGAGTLLILVLFLAVGARPAGGAPVVAQKMRLVRGPTGQALLLTAENSPAMMAIQCWEKGGFLVDFTFRSLPPLQPADLKKVQISTSRPISIELDGQPIIRGAWAMTWAGGVTSREYLLQVMPYDLMSETDYSAQIGPLMDKFLSQLRDGQRLTVKVSPPEGEELSAEFNLGGLDRGLDILPGRCPSRTTPMDQALAEAGHDKARHNMRLGFSVGRFVATCAQRYSFSAEGWDEAFIDVAINTSDGSGRSNTPVWDHE